MAEKSKYKRVILKLSGEALAGDKGFGIDPETVEYPFKARNPVNPRHTT